MNAAYRKGSHAAIEDFPNDPLDKAFMDTRKTELKFTDGNAFGKLTPQNHAPRNKSAAHGFVVLFYA
ncbi:MAG: hypothetical protein ACOX6U_02805 [Oscillospiraceae bacterium]|jgi:hypothetical protein